ncbi:MAG: hypothetical protein LBI18_05425 [Planctomycetaceae bacterium]|jgi:hypothetical protein|nr:hypothetical protein [Planctomycetaceae bacterium]
MKQLIEIEKKFYALAEDLYPTDETAAGFLASIWQNDRDLAKSAIAKIIIDLGKKPRITDAIVRMILGISCLEMDELFFEISSKRKCPPLSKILIKGRVQAELARPMTFFLFFLYFSVFVKFFI